MIDSSVVGKEYPTYQFEVEKGRIRAFAEAIGDENPLFVDTEHAQSTRMAGVIAPPTFATCFRDGEFTILMDLKVDLRKLLHGTQEYEFHLPIRPGDILTCAPSISAVKSKETKKGRMDFLTTQVKITNARDELVCVAKSTVAIRE